MHILIQLRLDTPNVMIDSGPSKHHRASRHQQMLELIKFLHLTLGAVMSAICSVVRLVASCHRDSLGHVPQVELREVAECASRSLAASVEGQLGFDIDFYTIMKG
jgi:hypothetical protein